MRLWMTTALLASALVLPSSAWAQTGAAAQNQGPDILFLALITTTAALGSAIIALALYLIRLRIGFWLHRPPPREGDEAPGHH